MRSREEIEKGYPRGDYDDDYIFVLGNPLILEVLLDIRDLLQSESVARKESK